MSDARIDGSTARGIVGASEIAARAISAVRREASDVCHRASLLDGGVYPPRTADEAVR